jgi:hypothetical protein
VTCIVLDDYVLMLHAQRCCVCITQVEVRNNGNLHTIGFARGKTVQPLEVIPGGADGLTGTYFKVIHKTVQHSVHLHAVLCNSVSKV